MKTKLRRKRWRVPSHATYGEFYASVYERRASREPLHEFNAWLVKRLRGDLHTLCERLQWSTHILTMARTQALGRTIDRRTIESATQTRRLCQLGQLLRLRWLQRRIVAFLWRPGGPLFHRHVPCDLPFLVTSTQGATPG